MFERTLRGALRRFGFDRPCKPSILAITLPKSGSVFLRKSLQRTLRLKRCQLSAKYFPEDHLDIRALRRFAEGGLIAQTHSDASSLNLAFIDRFVPAWFIHLRDPCGAVLSRTHHVESELQRDPDIPLTWRPGLPRGYVDLDFEAKLSWQIDHTLPVMVAWIAGWEAAPETRPEIPVTTFEKMAGVDSEFVFGLIAKVGEAGGNAPVRLPARTLKGSHFRKGDPEEWRRIFTADQLRRATTAIPPEMLTRFGWTR